MAHNENEYQNKLLVD